MRSLGVPFEHINAEQLIKRIYNCVSPLEASMPVNSDVRLTQGTPQIFGVTTPAPLTQALDVTWVVDSQPQGTGSFFTLETATLGAGSHTVEVVVEDTTALVLNDPAQLLTERRRWNVAVTPLDPTPALGLSLNQENFGPGETLLVELRAQQPGPAIIVDFYFGAILPDGVTTLFITSLSPLDGKWARLDADARSFQAMLTNIQIPQGFDMTFDNFLVHTFSGAEIPGVYTLIAAVTPPGAFGDGHVDAGDLLSLATKPFGVSPSGASAPVTRLPTAVQTIRERHTTK